MTFPVVTVGPRDPPGELAAALADRGARDVVEFRRGNLEESDLGQTQAEKRFRELEDAVAPRYEPAAAETRALAREIDASPGEILAYSGYSDFADLVRHEHGADIGCTVVGLRDPSPASGPLLAQTWDYYKFFDDRSLILERHPRSGYGSVAVTSALGHAYLGVNEAGVAVLVNNLMSRIAQVGMPFPVVVQMLLAQAGSAKEALSVLETADIMSTHNYLVGGPDAAYNVEAGAGLTATTPLDRENTPWVHTNHTVHEDLTDTMVDYSETSRRRFERMEAKLDEAQGAGDGGAAGEIPRLFVDHEAPICRHGEAPQDVETIGTIWVTRDPVTLHAVHGPPCSNEEQEVRVGW